MEKNGFFARMRNWMRSDDEGNIPHSAGGNAAGRQSGGSGAGSTAVADQDESSHAGDAAPDISSASHDNSGDPGDSGGPFSGAISSLSQRRRDHASIEQLRKGYEQVVELVDSIRRHQEVQDERATQIADSLGAISGTLQSIRTGTDSQTEMLSRIADELRAVSTRSGDWEQHLAELPRMVKSHQETLETVREEIKATEQRNETLAGSLSTFRDAVTSLSDATTANSVVMKDLQRAGLDSEERTRSLLQEQNKRFTMLFWVTVGLATAAVTIGVLGLVL